jgi:AcrR family transcriptional regulator
MASKNPRSAQKHGDESVRARILAAAMGTFLEHGFAAATTLEIATRAKVSKRELYAVVGNKQEMLAACIAGRGRRMRLPEGFPSPTDTASLRSALRQYGTTLLRERTDPTVLAVFRLAISESKRSPGIARSLESQGREPAREALRSLLQSARGRRLEVDDVALPGLAVGRSPGVGIARHCAAAGRAGDQPQGRGSGAPLPQPLRAR